MWVWVSYPTPAPARAMLFRWGGCWRYLDGLDGYGGPVGGHLGHDVAYLVAVEAHGDHGIAAFGARRAPHPFARLVAAVGEELGVAGDFTACQCPERGTEVAEVVAGSHDQAEDVTVHVDDPVPRHLVRRHDEDWRPITWHLFFSRRAGGGVACCYRGGDLLGGGGVSRGEGLPCTIGKGIFQCSCALITGWAGIGICGLDAAR